MVELHSPLEPPGGMILFSLDPSLPPPSHGKVKSAGRFFPLFMICDNTLFARYALRERTALILSSRRKWEEIAQGWIKQFFYTMGLPPAVMEETHLGMRPHFFTSSHYSERTTSMRFSRGPQTNARRQSCGLMDSPLRFSYLSPFTVTVRAPDFSAVLAGRTPPRSSNGVLLLLFPFLWGVVIV